MRKLKLAYISPVNNLPKYLNNFYNIMLFNKKNIHIFHKNYKYFDRIVYNLHNSLEYKFIYRISLQIPGILIMNSFHLNRVFNYNSNNIYKEKGYKFNSNSYPLNKMLINNSKGIIYKKRDWLKELNNFFYFYNKDKFLFYKSTLLVNYIESCYKNISIKNNLDFKIAFSSGEYAKQRQVLVDISSLVKQDLKTGIQRVVKNQLRELIKLAPLNTRVEPIYFGKYMERHGYFYAREFMSEFLNIKSKLKDSIVEVNEGDIFYGLDLVKDVVDIASRENIYKDYKQAGVKIFFLVYDLLPITRNWCFPSIEKNIHFQWINNISKEADGLISISRKVKKELKEFVGENTSLTHIHLGANIKEIDFSKKKLFKKPTFLMVGTIEPRKAHKQVIKAFEMLWKEQYDINLVIIGRKGWMVDNVIKMIQKHPKLNKNLFYLEHTDDKTLQEYYLNSWALIYPSFDEGFGLPIIEAAFYKLPIIARDTEVFREIGKNNLYYFKDSKSVKVVYKAIKSWLLLYKKGIYPKSDNISYLTWEESTKQVISILGLV